MKKYFTLILFFVLLASAYSQNVGVGTSDPKEKLHVEGSIRGGGRTIVETSRSTVGAAGGTVAVGAFSNDAVGRNIRIFLKIHAGAVIDVHTYEINQTTYLGNTTNWLEVPINQNSVSHSGRAGYVIDVYRPNIGSTSDPLYVRVRNKAGVGAGNVQLVIDYDDDVTFTPLTSQSDVSTAFDASSAPAGGVVSGLYGGLEWMFPVTGGSGWNNGTDRGLFVKNNGNVGIGKTDPQAQLHTTGTIRLENAASSGSNTRILTLDASGNLAYRDAGSWAGGSGTITGSGTANYTARWTSSTALGTGILYDNGSSVGIGTTTLNNRLQFQSDGSSQAMQFNTSGYMATNKWGTRIYKSDIGGGIPLKLETQYDDTWYATADFGHGQNNSHPSLKTYYATQLAVSGGSVGIGTNAPGAKLEVAGDVLLNSQSSLQKRRITTEVRSIGDQAGDYVYLGTITSNGAGTYITINESHHFCGTINTAVYEFSDNYYAGATTDWMQVPTQNFRGHNGVQDFAVDVRRTANHGAANMEIRFRNLGGGCGGGGACHFEIQTNGTFTASSTSGSGATVAGYLSSNAYQFPVSNDRSKASTDGLFMLNSGNVGIGITNPTYKLHIAGKVKSDGINETSDERLKKNILPIEGALSKVLEMKGVTYNWRKDEFPEKKFEEGKQYGLVAQELEKIIPELVHTDKEGWKSIEYSHIVPVLIEALKEQQAIIQTQQEVVRNLKILSASTDNRVTELETKMIEKDKILGRLYELLELETKK